MNAPKCHACGAIITNPQAGVCLYCRAPLAQYGHQQPYGQPPQQPHSPHGQPGQYGQAYGASPQHYHVQPWASPPVPPQQPWYNRGGGFWGAFWMIRLGIALFILFIVGVGSCISALSH